MTSKEIKCENPVIHKIKWLKQKKKGNGWMQEIVEDTRRKGIKCEGMRQMKG